MELRSPAAKVTVPRSYQPLPKSRVEEPLKLNEGLPESLSLIVVSPLLGADVEFT